MILTLQSHRKVFPALAHQAEVVPQAHASDLEDLDSSLKRERDRAKKSTIPDAFSLHKRMAKNEARHVVGIKAGLMVVTLASHIKKRTEK